MEKECKSEVSHPLTVDRCLLEVERKDETEELCEVSQRQLQLIYGPMTAPSESLCSFHFFSHIYSWPPPESHTVGPFVFNDM